MSRLSVMLPLLAGFAFAGAAWAQDTTAPKPPGNDARYTFHRSGDGFIRLDAQTGQVAQCGWGGAAWACKLVPDERSAMENEIARLQRDNADLKQALLSHNIELPNGMVADAQPQAAPPAGAPVPPANIPDTSAKPPQMPSEAEVDRAFAFMKHVWRRLVDMMADLQRDIQQRDQQKKS